MQLLSAVVCSVLLTKVLAVVRQDHYTKLTKAATPAHECVVNTTYAVPPQVVASPLHFLLWCGAWCTATPSCRAFCVQASSSACALYSSRIDRDYSGSASFGSADVFCYSGTVSVHNIVGPSTPLWTSTPQSLYDIRRMADHVYQPCMAPPDQSYRTQLGPTPAVRFDLGRGEAVSDIYVTASHLSNVEVRLGNSSEYNTNPLVHLLVAPPVSPSEEFRIPQQGVLWGRYLSFVSLNESLAAYIEVGEVRVIRAFG